jgi:hypothetical protein
MNPEEKEIALLMKQNACNHGFIKGLGDKVERCAHCGLSKPEFDEREVINQLWTHSPP